MTHEQIRQMIRGANPVKDPRLLEPVATSDLTIEFEERMHMQTDDRPSVDSGKTRGRGPIVAIAAAVAVLAGGVIFYLATRDDTPVATPAPNATELNQLAEYEPIDAGAYYTDADGDGPSTARGTFVIVEGWSSLIAGAMKDSTEGASYVSLLIGEVDELASPGCHTTEWVAAGPSAEAVAGQLATATGLTISDAVTPVTAFGQEGYHLMAEVPEEGHVAPEGFPGCEGDGEFDGWTTANWGNRYYQFPGQRLEFWVLDVEGAGGPILVEATIGPESVEADEEELQAAIDTLVITP
jgi:hypothetical protein